MPASYAQNYTTIREPRDEWIGVCADHEIPWMGEVRDERDDAYRDAFRHNQQFHGGHAVIPAHEMMSASMAHLEERRKYSYRLELQAKVTAIAMVPFCGFMYGWVIIDSPLMALAVMIMAAALINCGRTYGKIHAGNQIAEREHQKLKDQMTRMIDDE